MPCVSPVLGLNLRLSEQAGIDGGCRCVGVMCSLSLWYLLSDTWE